MRRFVSSSWSISQYLNFDLILIEIISFFITRSIKSLRYASLYAQRIFADVERNRGLLSIKESAMWGTAAGRSIYKWLGRDVNAAKRSPHTIKGKSLDSFAPRVVDFSLFDQFLIDENPHNKGDFFSWFLEWISCRGTEKEILILLRIFAAKKCWNWRSLSRWSPSSPGSAKVTKITRSSGSHRRPMSRRHFCITFPKILTR